MMCCGTRSERPRPRSRRRGKLKSVVMSEERLGQSRACSRRRGVRCQCKQLWQSVAGCGKAPDARRWPCPRWARRVSSGAGCTCGRHPRARGDSQGHSGAIESNPSRAAKGSGELWDRIGSHRSSASDCSKPVSRRKSNSREAAESTTSGTAPSTTTSRSRSRVPKSASERSAAPGEWHAPVELLSRLATAAGGTHRYVPPLVPSAAADCEVRSVALCCRRFFT